MDIWRHIRKFPREKDMLKLGKKERHKYEKELMIVGRIFVLVLVAVSVLWVPVVQNSQNGKLFDYIQQVSAYMAPSIAAVYTLAVLWERINEKGAFWGLMSALVIGAVRMILDFVYPEPRCGEPDDRPEAAAALLFHYMYFALFLFLWTIFVVVAISLLTQPQEKEYLYRLTFWTRFSREDRKDMSLRKKRKSDDETLEGCDNLGADISEVEMTHVNGVSSKIEGTDDAPTYTKDELVMDTHEKNGTHSSKASQASCDVQGESANGETKKGKPEGMSPGSEEGSPPPSYQEIIRDGEENKEKEPIFRRFYQWFCGFSTNDATISDDEMKVREQEQMEKVIQRRRDVIILNIACVLVVAADIFLYAWYA